MFGQSSWTQAKAINSLLRQQGWVINSQSTKFTKGQWLSVQEKAWVPNRRCLATSGSSMELLSTFLPSPSSSCTLVSYSFICCPFGEQGPSRPSANTQVVSVHRLWWPEDVTLLKNLKSYTVTDRPDFSSCKKCKEVYHSDFILFSKNSFNHKGKILKVHEFSLFPAFDLSLV